MERIDIKLLTDERGLIGRECPACEKYFKVKIGTGLRTTDCICPYCGHTAVNDDFFTKDQMDYMLSYGAREVMGPALRDLQRTIQKMGRSTGGSIQIKTTTTGLDFPLKHYKEKSLETQVACDACGLEFAIYGVFANCPDCGRLNALTILFKSIEVAGKGLRFLDSTEQSEAELRERILSDALSNGVSSFDGFGKALRTKYPSAFPAQPRNLFQNILLLSGVIEESLGKSLQVLMGDLTFKFLVKWFQVRHIYEHNMGVIDEDFTQKVEGFNHLLGRKFPLSQDEITRFLEYLKNTSEQIVSMLPEKEI